MSLKSSLDYSLFPIWRVGEDVALDVVCVGMFEQLMLALAALPSSPTTSPDSPQGPEEVVRFATPLHLQKPISGVVAFNMHK